ncbi:hypothetical protein GCM10018980_19300 [Streptomyces capoamus]|uniref:HPr kinase n=1 Tax=Streptomyces capoamus TaxID=68183 RepID=A0A919C1X0_9ACTN|nr:hypothetical protein [Streptomyces capoamus]GGW16464.1 hypothetical protein GCM10010501_32890 [Streptomyces libani subsp. rufus]GHG42913.1 hypothetical protein GCM10018980_19300 [Streptomyces capoamus]
MREDLYEFYGYRVACTVPAEAEAVVGRLFGAPLRDGDASRAAWTPQTVHLSVELTDTDSDPVPPPYFPEHWDTSDVVVLDTASSRAEVTPARWTVRVTLARSDLGNPVVWGRWLVEKAFLVLTLRSGRHYGLHAGALSVDGRAALVTADSGVGKSTFTAWGLFKGADFAGEDAMMRHIDDPEGRFWGYPRCAYLDPALIKGRPELADAPAAPVPAREKSRVEWPARYESRLLPAVRPRALLVLTREHETVRPLDIDAVLGLCRDDFAAGKADPAVLERVEGDLRELLSGMSLLQFGLSTDLDSNFARLAAVLHG